MTSGSFQKIICPIDFSETSEQALHFAVEVARQHEAELIVMHVSDDFFGADPSTKYYTQTMGTFIGSILDLRQAVRRFPDAQIRPYHCLGNPSHEIASFAAAEQADLVIVGSHGRTGIRRFVLGSVAEQLLHRSEVDVLVFKPSETTNPVGALQTQPVVVPFDFSPGCYEAVHRARTLAGHGSPIHVVHVHDIATVIPHRNETQAQAEIRVLRENRDRFFGEMPQTDDTKVEFRTLFGSDVSDKLHQFILEEDASLVVMPSQKKRFWKRLFLGSVAKDLVRKTECPVMVLRNLKAKEVTPVADSDSTNSQTTKSNSGEESTSQ